MRPQPVTYVCPKCGKKLVVYVPALVVRCSRRMVRGNR